MGFFGDVAKFGGFGLIGRRAWERGQANKSLDDILKQQVSYTANPLANQFLGLSTNLFNAPMPGAAQAERNILSSQGNTFDYIKRNATDASQALAAASGAQANTDTQLSQQGLNEAGWKQSMLGNLNNAYQGMIGEGDKEFQDKIRRFMDLVSVRGSQQQNKQGTSQELMNLVTSIIPMLGGGFGSGFANARGRQG